VLRLVRVRCRMWIGARRAPTGAEVGPRSKTGSPSTHKFLQSEKRGPGWKPSGGPAAHRSTVIHRRRPWRSFEAVEFATLEWVDWFNNRRLLEPIGDIPPSEAEASFCATLEQSTKAA
jgi:transposase InsO family protein